ncbi:hypothetical protein ACJIZ3_019643 [Penstemon smallii]|uniref:Acyl-ACP thioesterase-like C-terminal domain-containing protein n=1 Tax=Penstemon smallii TaxID=265156 RepID=A0ABD3T1Q5_9LAMI
MASFPNHVSFCIQCSNTNINPQEPNKHKLHCVKINGSKSTISQALNTTHVDSFYQNVSMKNRQNIPTKKQLVDPYRQGVIVDDKGVEYKQTVTIRSYEVGPDKTATIDSILNLLQNVLPPPLILYEFYAASPIFLIVNKIRIEKTTHLLGDTLPLPPSRVMINVALTPLCYKNTFNSSFSISASDPTRLELHLILKYFAFFPIPDEFLENYQLSNIILEYRRECGTQDVVQSLCEPQEDEQKIGIIEQQYNHIGSNGNFSMSSEILRENGLLGSSNEGPFSYTHLLQIKGESKNEEILRGKTTWKKKISNF